MERKMLQAVIQPPPKECKRYDKETEAEREARRRANLLLKTGINEEEGDEDYQKHLALLKEKYGKANVLKEGKNKVGAAPGGAAGEGDSGIGGDNTG